MTPMMSPAVTDLGMGDSVKQQLKDAETERKKKLMKQANGMGQMQSMAAQQLFPGTAGYGNV